MGRHAGDDGGIRLPAPVAPPKRFFRMSLRIPAIADFVA